MVRRIVPAPLGLWVVRWATNELAAYAGRRLPVKHADQPRTGDAVGRLTRPKMEA